MWNVPWGGTVDSHNLGAMTAFGFLLIVLGQTCGYLCGERSMVQVNLNFVKKITPHKFSRNLIFKTYFSHSNLKNGVVNLVGALCFVSVGSLQIRHFNENEALMSSPEYAGDSYRSLALANGAMAIINGAVWLADALYCIVQVIND